MNNTRVISPLWTSACVLLGFLLYQKMLPKGVVKENNSVEHGERNIRNVNDNANYDQK